jgi:hypothetical protein
MGWDALCTYTYSLDYKSFENRSVFAVRAVESLGSIFSENRLVTLLPTYVQLIEVKDIWY